MVFYSTAGRYGGQQAINGSGTPLTNTAFLVYLTGTTTKAELFSDRTKSDDVANPVSSDASGNLEFYCDPGIYDLVSPSGSLVTISVQPDPDSTLTIDSDITAAVPAADPWNADTTYPAGRLVTENSGLYQAIDEVAPNPSFDPTKWTHMADIAPLFGTTHGTAAQGDDGRIVGALQKSSNLADLNDDATARTNLGVRSVTESDDTYLPKLSAFTGGPQAGNIGIDPVVFAHPNVLSYEDAPFPARLADGSFYEIWRASTNATNAPKGVFYSHRSFDGGNTWTTPVLEYSDATADVRDPSLSLMDDGRLAVTFQQYFGAATPSHAAQVMFSPSGGLVSGDWTTPVNLNSGFTLYDVCAGPMIDLGGGNYMVSAYGLNIGGTFASTFTMKSTDSGATWGDLVLVGDGPTDSVFYGEPQLVKIRVTKGAVNSGDLLMLIRDETNNKYRSSRSTDGGATWSAVSAIILTIDGQTGKPSCIQMASGVLVMLARIAGTRPSNTINTSWDGGATWTMAILLPDGPATVTRGGYSGLWEIEDNVALAAYALQTSSTEAQRFSRIVFDGTGITPRGTAANSNYQPGVGPLITQANATTSGSVTASPGDAFIASGSLTVTLPASPKFGQAVLIRRGATTALISASPNTGQTINGSGSAVSLQATNAVAGVGTLLLIAISATDWTFIGGNSDGNLGMYLGGGLIANGTSIFAGATNINGRLVYHQVSTSADYTVLSTDVVVRCTGTHTITVPIVNGQILQIINTGTGVSTVVPASGTIGGQSSITLPPGAGCVIQGTTTTWNVVGSWGMGTLQISSLPSASATYKGVIMTVPGNGTTTADVASICLMSATGTYSWKTLATG